MCGPKLCLACEPRAQDTDVIDYITLKADRHDGITDGALLRWANHQRSEKIAELLLKCDNSILERPEIVEMVHVNMRSARHYRCLSSDIENMRMQRALGRRGYEDFARLAVKFGFQMTQHSTGRRRTLRNRIFAALNRDRPTMNILLFAFQFGYDPSAVSVAVNRFLPSSPILFDRTVIASDSKPVESAAQWLGVSHLLTEPLRELVNA